MGHSGIMKEMGELGKSQSLTSKQMQKTTGGRPDGDGETQGGKAKYRDWRGSRLGRS